MKVKKCKSTLLYSTLVLCLWGGFPQVRAASFESFAIEQQSNKVIGTVKDEFGPVIGASVVENQQWCSYRLKRQIQFKRQTRRNVNHQFCGIQAAGGESRQCSTEYCT